MTIIDQIKTVAEDTAKTVSIKAEQFRGKVVETGNDWKVKVVKNVDPKVDELKAKAVELKDLAVGSGTDLKADVEAAVEEAKKVVAPKTKTAKVVEDVEAAVETVAETVVDLTEENQTTKA